MSKRLTVHCANCGKPKSIYLSNYTSSKHKRFYCDQSCKNQYIRLHSFEEICGVECSKEIRKRASEANSGKNNGNYGKKWSEESRLKALKSRQELMASEKYQEILFRAVDIRRKNGSYKVSETTRKRMSDSQSGKNNNFYGKQHSEESKKIIGIKSKNKFTPEFKQNQRIIHEERGTWIPLNNKSYYELYFKVSGWIDPMIKYLSEVEFALFQKYGIFNCRTNTKGLVRDHKYSRKSGFLNRVYPELLRHPCNCQLIKHSDNVRKAQTKAVPENSISLCELFDEITNYSGLFWAEHESCLYLIELYKMGKRYHISKGGDANVCA